MTDCVKRMRGRFWQCAGSEANVRFWAVWLVRLRGSCLKRKPVVL